MDDTLLQVGIGGALAVIIIREVLQFVRSKNGNGQYFTASDRSVLGELRDIMKAIDWQVNRNLGEGLSRLAEALDKAHDLQRTQFDLLRDLNTSVRNLAGMMERRP